MTVASVTILTTVGTIGTSGGGTPINIGKCGISKDGFIKIGVESLAINAKYHPSKIGIGKIGADSLNVSHSSTCKIIAGKVRTIETSIIEVGTG